jgi:HPt (histidine-containing phosphotransfer) domain-containing protein
MTAHAMAGDEQKSLEAGMNDHVTKPIDPDQLFGALQKWIAPAAAPESLLAPEVPPVPDEPFKPETLKPESVPPDEDELPKSLAGFDLAAGLARLMGNKRLYRKLLLDFGSKYTDTGRQIHDALELNDFDQAHSLIHNIKGLAGNLEATDLQAAAVEMEKLVKGQTAETAEKEGLNQKLTDLENALGQALDAVQTLASTAETKAAESSGDTAASIPADLIRKAVDRIKAATDMGDVMQVNSIAIELKSENVILTPICDEIIQLAEDFDLDGISNLVDELTRQVDST